MANEEVERVTQDGEITFDELKQAYNDAKGETKQYIRQEIQHLRDVMKALKHLSREGNIRGISQEIDDIDKDVNQRIAESRAAVFKKTKEREDKDDKWQEDHEGRSEIVTGAIKKVDDFYRNKKSQKAYKSISITGKFATGAQLVGQKGLAKEMQRRVEERRSNPLDKDTTVQKIMKTVAEKGFKIADDYRETRNLTQADEISIGRSTARKINENKEWSDAHKDRSKAVIGTVDKINEASVDIRSNIAMKSIKITGIFAKGAALVGRKDLARDMQDKAYNRARGLVTRDSRAARIAKNAAEFGFDISDSFKQKVSEIRDFGVGVYESGKEVAQNVAKTVRETPGNVAKSVSKGVLQFGVKHYEGIAAIAGIGEIGLEALSKGAEKVVQPVKEYAGKASSKIENVRNTAGKNFRGFQNSMLESINSKLQSVINRNSEKMKQNEQVISNTKETVQRDDEGR